MQARLPIADHRGISPGHGFADRPGTLSSAFRPKRQHADYEAITDSAERGAVMGSSPLEPVSDFRPPRVRRMADWQTEAEPVLRAIYEATERRDFDRITSTTIAEALDRESRSVARIMGYLADDGYIESSGDRINGQARSRASFSSSTRRRHRSLRGGLLLAESGSTRSWRR
jgi:hypothetical protein